MQVQECNGLFNTDLARIETLTVPINSRCLCGGGDPFLGNITRTIVATSSLNSRLLGPNTKLMMRSLVVRLGGKVLPMDLILILCVVRRGGCALIEVLGA